MSNILIDYSKPKLVKLRKCNSYIYIEQKRLWVILSTLSDYFKSIMADIKVVF